jgi:hypothetical protein
LDAVLEIVLGVVFGVVSGVELDVVLDAVLLRLATQTDEGTVLGGRAAAAAASTIWGGDTMSDNSMSDIMQCVGRFGGEKLGKNWLTRGLSILR